MTVKFFGTVTVLACLALLVAFSALAADPNEWSQEEREAGVKVQEFTRFIKPGHNLSFPVGFFSPDCALIEDSTPTISKQPNHGTATIETQTRFPYFPKDSANAKCNDKKIRMPVLTYKPEEGYTGTDTFQLTMIPSNGMMRQWNYTIRITNGREEVKR
jgi:hypothetical protein